MPKRAGKLDSRIRILFPVSTQTANGETAVTYPVSSAIDTWAEVSQPHARDLVQNSEVIKNNETVSITAYAIKIRHRRSVRITADCKILFQGRTLEISALLDSLDRNEEIQIVAYEKLPRAGV